MVKQCDYYLVPQSPFCYLGHERFVALAERYGIQINLKPCDLSKVFAVSGGLPLGKRPPQRQAYRLVELERWRDYLGMPLNLHPKFFPVAGEQAGRLIVAAQLAHGTARALALAGALMRGVWVDEKNIADEAELARIADASGMEGASLVKASQGASVQATYDQHTQDAIAANLFGAPWFVFDGVPYWGQDRLDFLERAFAA